MSNVGAHETKDIERARYVRSQSGWITALYALAFVRAAVALLSALSSLDSNSPPEFNGVLLNTSGVFFDAIIYSILGIAAYQRHLWGAYGLVAISLLELPIKGGFGGVGTLLGSVAFAACFVKGTIDLFNSRNFPLSVELDKRFILKWSLLILLIGVLSGFFQTFNPSVIQLVLGPPGSPGRVWGLRIAAFLFTCTALVIAVKRQASWPLEHVLCASLVAWIVGGFAEGLYLYPSDAMSGADVLAYVALQGLPTLATAFVAYGIARRLKPLTQGAGGQETSDRFN